VPIREYRVESPHRCEDCHQFEDQLEEAASAELSQSTLSRRWIDDVAASRHAVQNRCGS
jgi:hypothetical protein